MRKRFLRGLGGLVCLGLGLAGCSGGGGSGKKPPPAPQNIVTLLSTTCQTGVGNLPNSSCMLLRVETAGNVPADVELRVIEPTVPYVGTVVMCSGGIGSEFYSTLLGGEELIRDLTDIGLRVVDRRWVSGWMTTSHQLKPQAARLAELLDWVVANEHLGGLFFAVGNSGGSAELSYGLTTFATEDLFDAVVLAGGPPFTRIDYLCQSVAAWSALCPGLVPTLECGVPPCAGNATTSVCMSVLTEAEQYEDSILHPAADTDFSAEVHMIIGADDCSQWVPQAFLFETAITSQHTVQVVTGTPHTVSATPQGRDAIVQALLGFAPAPATAATGGWPVGFSFTLVEDGAPTDTLVGAGQSAIRGD